jgi:hypothetical protein
LIAPASWSASKIFPKQYGERIATEFSGPEGGHLQVAEIVDKTASIHDLLRKVEAKAKEIEAPRDILKTALPRAIEDAAEHSKAGGAEKFHDGQRK